MDTSDRSMMLKIIHSAINTKVLSRWSELACSIALDAVRTVELEDNGRKEIDIKKYAKVEKVRLAELRVGRGSRWPPVMKRTLLCVRFREGSSRTRAC